MKLCKDEHEAITNKLTEQISFFDKYYIYTGKPPDIYLGEK